MEQKADIPVHLLDTAKSSALIESWYEIVHLKQLYRQGWLKRDVPAADCETVAEHSFGNAMLCLLLMDAVPGLDPLKVLRMALIHDVGEAYVGDITPHDNVPAEDKARLEHEAIHTIFGKLPNGSALIEDWLAYEAQATPEARFVKEIDRLELAMQASVYDHQGKVDAEEFMRSAETHLATPALVKELGILRTLLADRA